jgi:Protein of unknown function (DUF3025)
LETGLEAIDWRAPWLAPIRDVGQQVVQKTALGLSSYEALNSLQSAPVRFVAHAELPAGQAYEHYIFHSKQCPTRGDLHDFLNGICWIHFPLTKTRLNQLQAAEIEKAGVGQVRGAVRDALTLFDENAALLVAPNALWNALVVKDWQSLFVTLRPLWQEARLVLFGHALMEKLVAPRKPITAHVYRVHPASEALGDLDAWVAQDLSAKKLATKPFAHLPVLGVPGWWPENEDPGFYADTSVFRAPRVATVPGK